MRTLALLLLTLPSLAQSACPANPDIAADRAATLTALAASTSPAEAAALADTLWSLWMQAPDARAQTLLDAGIAARSSGDFPASLTALDDLTTYCPDFPEGWNQRAFTRFVAGDYPGSLADIEATLAREPAHFGALSGEAQIFAAEGKLAKAQLVILQALAIHPWLNERALLSDQPL